MLPYARSDAVRILALARAIIDLDLPAPPPRGRLERLKALFARRAARGEVFVDACKFEPGSMSR